MRAPLHPLPLRGEGRVRGRTGMARWSEHASRAFVRATTVQIQPNSFGRVPRKALLSHGYWKEQLTNIGNLLSSCRAPATQDRTTPMMKKKTLDELADEIIRDFDAGDTPEARAKALLQQAA